MIDGIDENGECSGDASQSALMNPNNNHKAIGGVEPGLGFGLRHQHFKSFRKNKNTIHPNINWLEVHPENFTTLGSAFEILQELSCGFNLSYHGVGLSLGTAWDEESQKHLKRIQKLISHLKCHSFSEHISWSRHRKSHTHDLLPILYDDENLKIISDNINRVQDALGMQIAVENPSIYAKFLHKYTETDFINKILERTNCSLLLDINNIEVCAFNLGFQIDDYLAAIDFEKVREIHIAGHTERKIDDKIVKVDTHSRCASSNVFDCLAQILENPKFQGFVMYEWDSDMPEFDFLMNEVNKVTTLYNSIRRYDSIRDYDAKLSG